MYKLKKPTCLGLSEAQKDRMLQFFLEEIKGNRVALIAKRFILLLLVRKMDMILVVHGKSYLLLILEEENCSV